jgi:hypothetical protein
LYYSHFIEHVWNRLKLTIDTNSFFLNWVLCLGFWNVTNSWEWRRRKGEILINSILWVFWNSSDCLWRRVQVLVRFVGWLLNHLPIKYTARNQMFGRLELLVCVFSHFSFHFISCDIFCIDGFIHFNIWEICLFCLVYEIVAQCEPHVDIDPLLVGAMIRLVQIYYCLIQFI